MAQLSELIRKKYPGDYDDLDDDELESKVLKKYPEYEDLAKPKETPVLLKSEGSPEAERLIKEAKTSLSKPAPWENEENIPEEPKKAEKPKTSTDVKTQSESDTRSLSSRFADSISSVLDKGSEFIDRHPKIKEMWEGPIRDPEHELVGPGGLSHIPGVKAAGDWLANKIDPTSDREDRGIVRPFIAGAVQGLTGNILAHPLEFSELGPNAPPRIPKERGLPPAPSEFGPSSGRDVFDASFKAETVPEVRQRQSAEVPYRQESTVPPVRPPRDYAGPARTPEAPIDLKPPIAKPASEAIKPGFVDNAQTEFTNARGEISLRTPTPDRVAQLQDDGYTVARTLPSGAVIMSPPTKAKTVTEVKKAVNPFAKAPAEAASIAEIPRPEPIPEPIPEPSPQEQFSQSIEPQEDPFTLHPGVMFKEDEVPSPVPHEFLPTDTPTAEPDPFVQQAKGVGEDDLYKLARERFGMGLELPTAEEPISFNQPNEESVDIARRQMYGDDENILEARRQMEEPEENIFASAPKRQTDLAPALQDESVMDYHRRTGASIADSTKAVEGEDVEPSFARSQHPDDRRAQNIANETDPKIIHDTAIEWNNRAEQLEQSGDLSGAWRAREIARVANDRLKEVEANPHKFSPKASGAFKPDDLFMGSEGLGLNREDESFESQWAQATVEARQVGLNPADYNNLDQLQWDITRKAAEITAKTGKNPLTRTEGVSNAKAPKEDFIRMEAGNREDMLRNMVSQYAEHGARVANKELLQNSIDATPTGGKISVKLDYSVTGKGPSITVTDSGPGLNLDMIKNEYVTLTGSGKRGKESATGRKSIGEMGVGKATYLLGTDSFEVETVAKEDDGTTWRYKFSGTPEDMITGQVKVDKEKISGFTPTGTRVTVYDSDKKNVAAAEDYLNTFAQYSNSPVEVTIDSNRYPSMPNHKVVAPRDVLTGGKFVSSGSAPGGDFTITIPDSAVWQENQGSTVAILTARGMFQGAETIYPPGHGKLPDRIVVNIEPTVPASDAKNYPLTSPTRERMKGPFKQVITAEVDKNIMEAARARATQDLQDAYDELVPTKGINPFDKSDFVVYDAGGKLTPDELNNFNRNPIVRKIAPIMKDMLEILNGLFPTQQRWHTEKYGFLIDNQGKGGVNVPNPSTKFTSRDTAIMINLHDAILQAEGDPEVAAERIAHIIMHEFTHNIARDEGAGFTWSLSEVDSKLGTRRRANIASAIRAVITAPDGDYAPELQDLLQEYQATRGRQGTKVDLLSRSAEGGLITDEGSTGVSNARKPDGKGTSGGKRKKRDVSGAVDSLLQALQEAHGSREAQAEINKKTRAERFAAFSGVKTEGMAGAAKSLGKLRGEFEKVDISGFEDYLDEDQVNSLFDAIKYAIITPAEKARGYTALFTLLQGGNVPSRSDLAVLDEVFGGGFSNKVIEMHSGLPIKITKVANTMKALRSSFDLSAPLRQGMALWMKPEYRKALGQMFKFMINPEAYQAAMQSIHDDKDYLASREAGLFIAKPDDLVDGEEAFMNTYIPELGALIPGLKPGVKMSERAYTGFLNVLRFEIFKSLMNSLRDSGIEPYTVTHEVDPDTGEKMEASIVTSKALDDVAKFINVATGRGSLGRLEKMAPELNAVIWSPRLLASRLQMLNPKYYMGLEPLARMEALKALFGIATAGLIITGLFYLRGRKVSLNPTTADFMKARKGNNVVDAWTGYQQEIVAAARLATQSSNGRPKPMSETMEQFLTQKLSPIAALAYEVASAKKFDKKHPGVFTNKFSQQKNISTEIMNSFVPMFVQDAVEMSKQDLPFSEKVGLDMLSMFGMGVQNYPEANTKGKGKGISKPSIR